MAAAAAGLTVTASLFAAGVSSAAPTQPPWEPDPNAAAPYGTLAFYNSAGTQVTSGTNLNHLFDYAVGSTPGDAGATKATLYFAAPNHNQPTFNWYTGNPVSASTGYPNPFAPASLPTGRPYVTLASTDANLNAWIGGAILDTTPGYANIVQTRMFDSGPGGVNSAPHYWDADVAYNTSSAPITVDGVTVPAGGWAQVYPAVSATPTTTTLASSTNPSVSGQQVTYTATVAPTPDGGTVAFSDGGSPIAGCGSVAVTSGTATCSVTYTSMATHSVTAAYSGDVNFAPSTSAALTQTVNKASTTTSLGSTSPAVTGQAVSYSATVAVTSPGAGNPTGTVAFTDSGSPISGCTAVPLSAGRATCQTAPATVGAHTIGAAYSGDSGYAGSTAAPVTQTVTQAATSTKVTSSVNPSYTGQAVTYSAAVAPTAPGGGTPTGAVSFSDSGAPIAGCTAQALAAGVATCTVTYSATGTHQITATYAGDTNYTGSASPALTQTVQAATVASAPQNLVASPHSGSVALTWTAPASNGGSAVTGYNVYEGTAPGAESTTPVNSTPVNSPSFTVSGLTNGTKYFFVVKAVNGIGTSAASNEASATPSQTGYRLAGSDGGVFAFGGAAFLGSMGGSHLNAPIVGIADTLNRDGYWLVGADGGIFSFGKAGFHGSTGGMQLNAPMVGMASPDDLGYWTVGSDGGVFSFGDARFYGSLGGTHLNAPIVGMAAVPGGGGYWLVASDGGVFAYGRAAFAGSLGGTHLNAPIVGISAAPGGGYRLVAADGGVFDFGGANFDGSAGGIHLASPVVGMIATAGNGYWLIGADGGVFSYGDATYQGSVPASGVTVRNIIGGA